MRLVRLLALLPICACADIFGFQDLNPDRDAAIEAGPIEAGVDAAPPVDASEDAAEASIVCDGGSTVKACGGQCVDIASSGANCGACGHDCGGGTCSLGVCQPSLLADALSYPVFDIDATNFYFNSASKVLSCPLDGCKLQPTQVEDTQTIVYGSDSSATVMVADGNVFFVSDPIQNTSRPTLHFCSIAACTPTVLYNAGLIGGFPGGWAHGPTVAYWTIYKQLEDSECSDAGACSNPGTLIYNAGITSQIGTPTPMVADSTGVYFVHPQTSALLHCPATGACSSPDTLEATTSGVAALALAGTKLYLLHSGTEGGIPNGHITTCPTTGTCSEANFAAQVPYPTHIVADSSGVYWFDVDAPLNSSATNQIVMCPLSGCTGGPFPVAANQAGTALMRTDSKFVYWATASQIWRVAK